jgi:hypothetical protein
VTRAWPRASSFTGKSSRTRNELASRLAFGNFAFIAGSTSARKSSVATVAPSTA